MKTCDVMMIMIVIKRSKMFYPFPYSLYLLKLRQYMAFYPYLHRYHRPQALLVVVANFYLSGQDLFTFEFKPYQHS